MCAKGDSAAHVKESAAKIKRLARECKWQHLSDIAATGFDKWRTGQKDSGTAAMTLNHYLTVAKTFCNWLVKEKRQSENPLAHLSKLNAEADRRLERHPYSVEELGLLLAAAEAGPVVHGMTGPDRALLYRSAVDTGFRWSELRSLLRASFDFQTNPAAVTIAAADAKNGRTDTLPLRPELAADLERRMALFLPTAKAFPGMWEGKGAEMIRVDLEAAGILRRDADGEPIITDENGLVYDFHALRHAFATLLNKARVPLATAQRLMRHSDPKLTSKIYTHVLVADKADELAKLPRIAAAGSQNESASKTGTDDAPFSQVRNAMDTRRDTFALDSDGEIRSYMEFGSRKNLPVSALPENEKAPVPQGQTGSYGVGSAYPIRTGDLRFAEPERGRRVAYLRRRVKKTLPAPGRAHIIEGLRYGGCVDRQNSS